MTTRDDPEAARRWKYDQMAKSLGARRCGAELLRRVDDLEAQMRDIDALVQRKVDAARDELAHGFNALLTEGRVLYKQVQELTEKAAG